MLTILQGTADLAYIISFMLISAVVAFAWAPFLTRILYHFKVVKGAKTELAAVGSHAYKTSTPVMGGLLVIVTIAVVTYALNWSRSFTWVPVGIMIIAALLGAIDDLLNIYGTERRSRKIGHVWNLIKVHKEWRMRLWYLISLPWTAFKRLSVWFGSRTRRGVFVHEKLLLQFAAGAIAAYWIYAKLGPAWHFVYFPFGFDWNAGWLIVPIVIFIVMFTANAVNITDGMDGMTGGMLIITFSALSLISWINGFGEIAILNATAVGALSAYTYFNIKPARFMMGDVGSLGLGALLAVNAMAIGEIGSLPFLGFMFYVEALSVIIQVISKYLFGKKVFAMAPLHHHFELKGWSEEKTVMRFWVIHFIFVVFGFWLALH
ncbi:phospho-N-acetylmuramoyl-pentapeptide-transferase [Patescibacteria group bacterium]|nr:phospho-N-acetylmuramoyl-pentapeptide-transferase [Patescibacteria group bacterium]MDE1946788.1 phospho-N-acetylmuramoyl-pentapeptide-transferase [Patescibacteria group bacterium]MDE2011080.1 phospho-N-acetylmuramoyl-pentapeptide-transferase [Patescibacteria group bacterium]MDE2233137.1 phospho-N-acetylmuramoyl-pentapeptide-transferase [Patescibacteria group bacterium]